jgi:hypothetical protein
LGSLAAALALLASSTLPASADGTSLLDTDLLLSGGSVGTGLPAANLMLPVPTGTTSLVVTLTWKSGTYAETGNPPRVLVTTGCACDPPPVTNVPFMPEQHQVSWTLDYDSSSTIGAVLLLTLEPSQGDQPPRELGMAGYTSILHVQMMAGSWGNQLSDARPSQEIE